MYLGPLEPAVEGTTVRPKRH